MKVYLIVTVFILFKKNMIYLFFIIKLLYIYIFFNMTNNKHTIHALSILLYFSSNIYMYVYILLYLF